MKLCIVLILSLFSSAFASVPEDPNILRNNRSVEPLEVFCEGETVQLTWVGTQTGVGQGDVKLYLVASSPERVLDRSLVKELDPSDLQNMRISWFVEPLVNILADTVHYRLELATFEGTDDSTTVRTVPFYISWYSPLEDLTEVAIAGCSSTSYTIPAPKGIGNAYVGEWVLEQGSSAQVNNNAVDFQRLTDRDEGLYTYTVFNACGNPVDTVVFTLSVVQWPPVYDLEANLQGGTMVLCEEDAATVQIADPSSYEVQWILTTDNDRVLSQNPEVTARSLPNSGVLEIQITSNACSGKTQSQTVPFKKYHEPQLEVLEFGQFECRPVVRVNGSEDVMRIHVQEQTAGSWQDIQEVAGNSLDFSEALSLESPMRVMLVGFCDTSYFPVVAPELSIASIANDEFSEPLTIGRQANIDIVMEIDTEWISCVERTVVRSQWDPRNAVLLESEHYTILDRQYSDSIEQATLEFSQLIVDGDGLTRLPLQMLTLFGVDDELQIEIDGQVLGSSGQTLTSVETLARIPLDVWKDTEGDAILRENDVWFATASPNPTETQSQVSLDSPRFASGVVASYLLNTNGQQHPVTWILEESTLIIDVEGLAPGLYYVLTQTKTGQVISSLVVQ